MMMTLRHTSVEKDPFQMKSQQSDNPQLMKTCDSIKSTKTKAQAIADKNRDDEEFVVL
jgi:hypothetical protein